MMRILEEIDVGGVGDQIWIEPIHYGIASDIAQRLNEVFDLKGGGRRRGGQAGREGAAAPRAATCTSTKIIADDRSNSLIIVATERAYLRILELIKRLDVPQSGEGEIHVLPLQHADADRAREDAERDRHGRRRGRAGGRRARRSRAATPLDDLRVGRQGQRRQGDQLDRRHLDPARLRERSARSSTASTSRAARCSSRR